MGPIQSGINQSISILGLMATQTAKFKNYQEKNALKKDLKETSKVGKQILGTTADYIVEKGFEGKLPLDKESPEGKAMKSKLDVLKDVIIKEEEQYKDLALKGDKKAFEQLTSEKRARGWEKVDEFEEKLFKNTNKAQSSLSAKQQEVRNAKPNIDMDKIDEVLNKQIPNINFNLKQGFGEFDSASPTVRQNTIIKNLKKENK